MLDFSGVRGMVGSVSLGAFSRPGGFVIERSMNGTTFTPFASGTGTPTDRRTLARDGLVPVHGRLDPRPQLPRRVGVVVDGYRVEGACTTPSPPGSPCPRAMAPIPAQSRLRRSPSYPPRDVRECRVDEGVAPEAVSRRER